MNNKLIALLMLIAYAAIAQTPPHPSATLTWNWSQGTGDPATGFHVQRSTAAGGPYTTVGTVLFGAPLSYVDVAVTVGATYYYVVTAYNPAGESVKSNEVTCTLPFQVPATPTTLSVTAK